METKDMLKNRYRQLAKQYHPDNGGDEHMFQCVSEVYDELQSKI
jgi:DnaJ-class molecular chaperone